MKRRGLFSSRSDFGAGRRYKILQKNEFCSLPVFLFQFDDIHGAHFGSYSPLRFNWDEKKKAALFPVVPAVPLDRRSRAAARQSQLTTAGSQSDLWWLGCDCPLRVWADRAQLQLCSVNPGEA